MASFAAIGVLVGLVVIVSSQWLVTGVFSVATDFVDEASVLMRLGGVWLGCKLFESGCVALVKGSQRYDLAARVTIIENLALIAAALILSNAGFGLREV